MSLARSSRRGRLRGQRIPGIAETASRSDGSAGRTVAPILIRKTFHFEAAHLLPFHPGKCARLHGHSYRLEVAVCGPLRSRGPARGMVEDFDRLERIVGEKIVAALDHQNLNDFMENPTAEQIVLWIWKRLAASLPRLDELVLWETQTSCAVLRRYDILSS